MGYVLAMAAGLSPGMPMPHGGPTGTKSLGLLS